MKVTPKQAKSIIENGGIIAYPTETTFGLGCCALNETALKKLIQIKQRSADKGLIVLINNYEQLKLLTPKLSAPTKQLVKEKWPGPYTFVFPCLSNLPKLLTGKYDSIAIRMSSHPIAYELAENTPITSTSANISNQSIINCPLELEKTFGHLIDGIIYETPGNHAPSSIIDALTGKQYR